MVSYQTMTAVAFEVARNKGATFDGQRPEDAQAVIEIVADEWNAETQRYKQMTEAQVRSELQSLLEVR